MRDEVFPRRQNMLALAGRIDALNEQQLDAGNRQVVSLLLSFQTRLLLTLLAALALGGGLALFTMRKTLKLEDQARMQFVEVEEARTQLKELSARLVQAQETERRSLSRELHDEVGQALSAVLVELRNLSGGSRSGPKNSCAATWKPSKAWWKARCAWFATWRFCCGHRC